MAAVTPTGPAPRDRPGAVTAAGQGRRRSFSRQGLGLAVALVLLALAGDAAGHAVLLESSPPQGARLDAAPTQVQVVLTETIDPSGSDLRVTDQDGRHVDDGDVHIDAGTRPVLTVRLRDGLGEGAYSIRWVALSTVDGHTTTGVVGFAVGGFEPPEGRMAAADAFDAPATIARALAFLGAALVLGAVVHGYLFTRPAPRLLAAGALLHAIGVILLLRDAASDSGLQLRWFTQTDVGGILLPRTVLAGVAAALALVWMARPVRLSPAVVAALVMAAAFYSARLGHASQGGPSVIALDGIHFIASAAWVGGLAAFILVLRRPASAGLDTTQLHAASVRFGTLATVLVVVTVGTGLVVTSQILGYNTLRPGTWSDSTWGRLLMLKWVLLAGMIALAARNRWRFVQRHETAHHLFPRSVAAEAVFGALVLVAAGALTAVGAPAFDPPSVERTFQGDDVFGTLQVRPEPKVGQESTLRFFVQSADGPIEGNDCGRTSGCLWVEIGEYGSGSRQALQPDGDGYWRTRVLWTQPGPTNVTLEVQSQAVYFDTAHATVDVAA